MSTFGDFLEALGHLHDCTIRHLEWNPKTKRIVFKIDDLYFNFKDLPEYRGPLAGTIVLEGVGSVYGDIAEFKTPLHIYEFSVINGDEKSSTAVVSFWPSGKITIPFHHATFPQLGTT